MPVSSAFLNKCFRNFPQSSVSKTPECRSIRSEVGRSVSGLRARVTDSEGNLEFESDNQVHESNEASEGATNFTTDYSKNASSSVGQVSVPIIEPTPPPPQPVFAVPLAPAPKSQSSASVRFIEDVKKFLANEFMSDAKKDYIICKLGLYIIKKSLEKSHGECMETRRKKEEIFQSFIRSGLMTPANVDALLNAQFPSYDVASIANFSVQGRSGPGSVFSNSSFHPYQPVPMRLNYPARNMESIFENSVNPPRGPFSVCRLPKINESRVSSLDPLRINNMQSSRSAPQGFFRITDNDQPSTQVTSSSSQLPSSLNVPKSIKSAPQVPPKQLQETQSKDNVKRVVKRRSPSPIPRPEKRRMVDSGKKAVANVKKYSRPQVLNDSIGNHSITRSGRISRPISKYWEMTK